MASAAPFDAVLLDAPCSSTGTIRRHPDVPWLKSEADIAALAALQQRLLDRAVDLLKPGGTLVYCVCSLEPEEGEQQIAALLARDPRVARAQLVAAPSIAAMPSSSPPKATCARLPLHLPDPDPRWGGLDGFYAARLTRKARPNPGICQADWPRRRPFAIVSDCARASGRARRGRATA